MAERNESRTNETPVDDEPLLKAAVLDVTIPAGLDARLKSALRSRFLADPAPSVPQVSTVERAIAEDTEEVGWLRRGAIVLALAAAIVGFAVLASRWTRPTEPSWLARQCELVLESLENENPATWQRIDREAPDVPAAVKSQLARVTFVSQRPWAAANSKMNGTLYRLDAGDGRGIILMKLPALSAVRGLTSRFEVLPTPSGGWSLAVMSVGAETYVLAAACTEQQIFTYIRRQALT